MPGHTARWASYCRALESLNAIPLTIDQIERGHRAYVGGCSDPFDPRFEMRRLEALQQFCRGEQLRPTDLASDAILLRYRVIGDAWMMGVDLRATDPALYASLATAPIDPALLSGLPDYEDEGELLPIYQ